jgi:hypothetical protein
LSVEEAQVAFHPEARYFCLAAPNHICSLRLCQCQVPSPALACQV